VQSNTAITKKPIGCYNLRLAWTFIMLNLLQYFVLPLYMLAETALWGLLLLPIVLLTMSYWALIHETFHGVFHHDQAVNNRYGRILCILFGSPFDFLRYGHLMHHRFNRTELDSSEVFDLNKHKWSAWLRYYFMLFIGLYVLELIGCLLFLLPNRWVHAIARRIICSQDDNHPAFAIAQRQLLAPDSLARLRTDALFILLLLGSSFYLHGELWPLLLLALTGRGLMISFSDNAFHYGTPLNDRHASFNLALPPWASKLILHFNLHRVHHKYPGLSWHELPAAFARDGETSEGGYVRVSLRQLRGPIDQRQFGELVQSL
jgi:fatty acid desaturase